MDRDLIYVIPKASHSEDTLTAILVSHPEIKFVSLVGIDLSGNDTDEKIPIKVLLEDISSFLKGSIQTDGSSVVLMGIATLNNAKVDMPADLDSNWYIDYNYENYDDLTGKPIGTLRIPCFLIHEKKAVDSRAILKGSLDYFKEILMNLFKESPNYLQSYGVHLNDVEDIIATAATELEFWVKTPNNQAIYEELSTSQYLQEQYWTRTRGVVRCALEETLISMGVYGLEPEMGHKEVGGVNPKISETGDLAFIMEQIEIDWKYSDALQAADNEVLVRTLITEIFRRHGLEVSFKAKPINGVAGNGEHTHVGIALKLKDGRIINLFTATKKHFLSVIGYASSMGILKNYEVINPFVTSTNDALNRLKPGFEAPICIVTSLGLGVEVPSRNRSVLLGLIRDMDNPLATRFELRSPNPFTNTYLALSSIYLAMLDGIKYALKAGKNEDDLLGEISKDAGDKGNYLEKERAYRSEEDIFEDYTDLKRIALFGEAPSTVYDNLSAFDKYPEKTKVITDGNVISQKILDSFKQGALRRWITELNYRITTAYIEEIRSYSKLHGESNATAFDLNNWMKVQELREYIAKDSDLGKSLISKIKYASDLKDYSDVSSLQIELEDKMKELRESYSAYQRNILD
ncbi:MAG TPA: glutamine synthetase [Clostridiaceae bacterium]